MPLHAHAGPEKPLASPARPAAGGALQALCLLLAVIGTPVMFYAMLGLPWNDHSGMGEVRGWLQFALAAGTPIGATVGVVAADGFRRGNAGPRRALLALALALLCAIGWVLVFFD